MCVCESEREGERERVRERERECVHVKDDIVISIKLCVIVLRSSVMPCSDQHGNPKPSAMEEGREGQQDLTSELL